MKKINIFMLVSFMTLFVIGCSNKSESISENNAVMENNNNTTVELNAEEINSEETFISDCSPQEINYIGNSFGNLGLMVADTGGKGIGTKTGRITKQGAWIYYYEKGMIYKMHENGEKISICNAQEAYSINIIGDWIYYLEGEQIYKVRTDGEYKELVLENVKCPFLTVKNNNGICLLIYVTSKNISATTQEYFIQTYNTDSQNDMLSANVGTNCPNLIGYLNGCVYYYYREAIDDVYYVAYCIDGATGWYVNNLCYEMPNLTSDNKFLAAMSDETILSVRYTFDVMGTRRDCPGTVMKFKSGDVKSNFNIMGNDFMTIRNIKDSNLIVYAKGKTQNFGLYLVDENTVYSTNCLSWRMSNSIVEEVTTIVEVYVIGDYVYYTVENYNEASIYRVKIDGTEWSQL